MIDKCNAKVMAFDQWHDAVYYETYHAFVFVYCEEVHTIFIDDCQAYSIEG